MEKIFSIVFVLLISIYPISLFGQAHGIPSSIRELSLSGNYLPESEDLLRFKTGVYFSKSTRFYLVNHDLVKPSSYNDYNRYGMFFELDK